MAINLKPILRRSLWLLLALLLAGFWILLDARPASALYNNMTLKERDFSGEDLSGEAFVAADMRRAKFVGANLSNAILTKGVLLDADLTGADLSFSLSDRVTFDRARLTNAIFTGAIATRSRFFEAEITGADFTDAILDRYQVNLMCKRATGINPVTGVSTRRSLGCP